MVAKKVTKLEDLLVEEVSIVDRPANTRRFLTVKNEGEMGANGSEVVVDDEGNLITTQGGADSGEQTPPKKEEGSSLAKAFADAGQAMERVEKGTGLSLPQDVRSHLFRNLEKSLRNIHTVLGFVDVSQSDEGADSAIAPVLAKELANIGKSMMDLSKQLGGVSKSDDESTSPNVDAPAVNDNFIKTLEALTKSFEALSSAPEKTPTPNASDDAQEAIVKSVSRLVQVVEAQGKQIRKLSQKPVASSNAISVEKSAQPDEECSWPLDMNADRSREATKKNISFHD